MQFEPEQSPENDNSGVHFWRSKSEHNLTHGVFGARFEIPMEADVFPIGFARIYWVTTAISVIANAR